MATAKWNGKIVAESNTFESMEGNLYFPPESINKRYFKPSAHETVCSWKGTAKYYTLEVNGKLNQDAAWYYPEPKEAAAKIQGYVAFWKGVEVLHD